ncbi:hypothetical protein PFMALIP_03598 [Plasmodium falciparum MaliPS096_E11]|uniref:Tetratricopeptide SHNi-TPR domain-containing protein n=1 Tax=Plasmodium falciparum MaliPS096_E11 TaxID=1036727 RepID=A0A024WMG8_PLAFA|nr:hypothetical protein PFMALIP_03598 [Plasmodium falciparum MaliPS096_E11]
MSEEEVIANDSSNTNVDSDVDEQRELLETRTAQELFDMGRLEFKENKNYDVAAERFSMAVEKKVKELNIEGSIHSDLREFYLSFADALLTKEEEKNDLFEFLKKKKQVEVSDNEEAADNIYKFTFILCKNIKIFQEIINNIFSSKLYYKK